MYDSSIADRDFRLLLKAIQVRDTEDSNLRCHCGLLEEDVSFVNKCKGLENSSRTQFTIPPIFKLIYDRIVYYHGPTGSMTKDDISATKTLKNIFCDMPHFDALVTCGNLLIIFHEKNRCTQYLTSALKFYLESFDIAKKAEYFSFKKEVLDILSLSCKYRVHRSVFSEILRVFYITPHSGIFRHMTDHSPTLEDIFDVTQGATADVLNVWKSTEEKWRRSNSFYCSLFENIRNFIPFIKLGRLEYISIESCSYLSRRKYYCNPIYWKNPGEYGSISFRCMQIMYVVESVPNETSSASAAIYAMKLLWNSITDPFLCQEDFNKSFDSIWPLMENNLLRKAWTWYDDHVLENKNLPKGPRSLSHFSRCSLRQQLATCLQLPCGVERLDLPRNLKDYILLEDCNVFRETGKNK